MNFQEVMGVLKRYWRSIILVLLVVGAVGTGVQMLARPTYSTGATLIFVPKPVAVNGNLAGALESAGKETETFAQLASMQVILEPVRQELGLENTTAGALASQVRAAGNTELAMVSIVATSSDPKFAADLANAVARQLVTAANVYAPATAGALDIKISQEAGTPTVPSNPNLKDSAVKGLAAGLVLGIAQAFIRRLMNSRLDSVDEVERLTKRPIVGEIPFDKSAPDDTVSLAPNSLRSEAYRRLRTNLQFVVAEKGRASFVITSSVPGEGKTSTAVNVAVSLAEAGQRVILVDADLRRPRVHKALKLEGTVGLTSVLAGKAEPADVIQTLGVLDVLPAGVIPPNPSELLGSRRMQETLDALKSSYDVVVIDTPPLLPVTDAVVLARMTDGAVVIAAIGTVRRRQFTYALSNLANVDATILGIVLNKLPLHGGNDSGYYYGYSYSYAYSTDGKRTRLKAHKKRGSSQAPVPVEAPTRVEAPVPVEAASVAEPTAVESRPSVTVELAPNAEALNGDSRDHRPQRAL